MRFRMSPYHISMLMAVSIVSSLFSVACGIMAWHSFPDGVEVGALMSFLMLLSIVEAIRQMRLKGFPWISFSLDGIRMDWKLGVHEFLPWEKCLDVGVFIADYGGSRYTALRYWIYFSTTVLTQKQLNTRRRPKLRQDEFIMVEYRPDVLNEVLKYIPKDQIRNLHLIEQ